MKWESLLFIAIAAGSALARKHDMRDHVHIHHHQPVLKARLRARGLENVPKSPDMQPEIHMESATVHNTVSKSQRTTRAYIDSSRPLDVLPVRTRTVPRTSRVAARSTSGEQASWIMIPSNGVYRTAGFGERTRPSGSGIDYSGNVGNPWGSNIIQISEDSAWQYQYVVQIRGSSTREWTVVFWNKIGPDGKMGGWYGHSALTLTLPPGTAMYVAFDADSQGAWGAAEGRSLPTDAFGGYACTWGEFDFGNSGNGGWSGWDVSAIQAQNAKMPVQGMRICDYTGEKCSSVTTNAASVVNAYTAAEAAIDGIGGSLKPGPVRLVVELDYNG
ncbi:putative allergen Asp F4-like [Aspergillus clavatus NRRL 1]|uniref:Allergen Asp F4, putative n=1 Tax=Aspergillus clavatus (strain ATCC 1007 / CBS 513.65 / DSM 816 / NCTC 3887 / NRRL 1 / QM 1276 / 107) TaxID=344612 RepID=A1CCV2_ASPCL|nr:allergen Asp F4 precursor, putative [Aspergillus clavatus NRRL 1]EAW12359.1 allergen Asp F4 precursor, putative [Aspergillus clavatus NRRL 1]